MRSTKWRVFCADDHEDTRSLLSLVLGQSDFEVGMAKTVADGLALARRERFDLYVLSGRFPDGTGFEMCRRIRQFDPLTPVLFYSAAAHESDRQRGISAGAQAYIAKPGNIFELVKTIKDLISNSSSASPERCAHQ